MTVPWLLKDPPFRAQTKALELAAGRRGFGFFLEMRLGKTRCVLAEWLALRQEFKLALPNLELVVLAPNSMKGAWKNEALDQGFAGVVRVWERDSFQNYGAVRPRMDESAGTMYVFNYESVLYGGGDAIERLVASRPIYLALDESVHIKNFNAQVTKNVIGYSKDATFRRVLSGNPRPETVMDLWAQLRAIGELDGVNPYAFRGTYAVMGGFMRKQVVGTKNEDRLQALMRRCSFVASQEDWSDLPGQIYLPPRRITMTAAQAKAYKEMWNDFIVQVNDKECSAEQMINVMNKCQQISSGFIYDDDRIAQELVASDKNPKLRELLDVLEDTPGKVIVPCFYRPSCFFVRDMLEKKGRRPAMLVGGMSTEEVDEQKRRFNSDEDCRVFVVQTRTGKYGHTLIGTDDSPCHTTVFFENDYSLDARIQVEQRNRHPTRHQPTEYLDLTASPAEDKVVKRLQQKREVSADFLRSVAHGADSE